MAAALGSAPGLSPTPGKAGTGAKLEAFAVSIMVSSSALRFDSGLGACTIAARRADNRANASLSFTSSNAGFCTPGPDAMVLAGGCNEEKSEIVSNKSIQGEDTARRSSLQGQVRDLEQSAG